MPALWRLWLEPELGTVVLGSMTPETWRAWHVTMLTERPKSTQPAKAYRLARTMLNQAVEDGLLRINPCRSRTRVVRFPPSDRLPCPTRWRKSQRRWMPNIRLWSYWRPMAHCASVSWLDCDGTELSTPQDNPSRGIGGGVG